MLRLTHGLEMEASDDRGAGGSRRGILLRKLTKWVALAAAPTFALMALTAGLSDGGQMICSSMPAGLPLDGMMAMYLLMSFFHITPWLNLAAGQHGKQHFVSRSA